MSDIPLAVRLQEERLVAAAAAGSGGAGPVRKKAEAPGFAPESDWRPEDEQSAEAPQVSAEPPPPRVPGNPVWRQEREDPPKGVEVKLDAGALRLAFPAIRVLRCSVGIGLLVDSGKLAISLAPGHVLKLGIGSEPTRDYVYAGQLYEWSSTEVLINFLLHVEPADLLKEALASPG